MEPSDAAISESFDTPDRKFARGYGRERVLPLGVVRRGNLAMQLLMPCACVRKRLTNSKAALEVKYRRLKARLGTSKAIVAMAHHLGSSGRQPSTRWARSQTQIAWSVPSEPCSSIWWSWPNGDGS